MKTAVDVCGVFFDPLARCMAKVRGDLEARRE